ncbi:3-deoxy-D-manno-octulosonic acid transferase [Synergistaceae bacterium OttesenSCG-928-D05]|nr:3-deoxy-D-manno-octulosonic acid transferase [Synergistaceae bacterium OttesenSCG-928-D05]
MLRALYQPLINAVFSLMWPKLRDKYTEGYDERRGSIPESKIEILRGARPFWVHGVSVGEVQAAIPLIKAARAAGYRGPVVVSTTTETGKAMALRLGTELFDFHIYYPWDKKNYVQAALNALNPWAFAALETELWPNMLWELRDRAVPAFLANGRLSDRTMERLRGFPGRAVGRHMYNLFTELYLREDRDADRLLNVGIAPSKLFVFGDSKIDALLERREYSDIAALRDKMEIGDAPVFIAGSTHIGEDEEVCRAFRIVKKEIPNAKLILAPRHPERIADIAGLFNGLHTTLFSSVTAGWDVLLVDRIGVLFELYGLSNAAFVGGSLVDKGGQNILEPAVWGVPIEHGPYMEDFTGPSEELQRAGLVTKVSGADELAADWLRVMNELDRTERFKAIAEDYFAVRSGAAQRTWQRISEYASREGGTDAFDRS